MFLESYIFPEDRLETIKHMILKIQDSSVRFSILRLIARAINVPIEFNNFELDMQKLKECTKE